ncbi:MAG: hypothetical protein C0615_10550 [Desulfuromonas sp.]|nr:MAG: hypothetical protein C0615_10550 [Desulfuromonas sp.]
MTWQGDPYALTSVDFVAPDKISLNAPEDLEDNFIGKIVPSAGSINGAGTIVYPVGTDNSEVTISRATSAQNCHRYIDWNNDGDAADLDEQPGWNTVTPW